jgi:glutamine synthetase
LTADALRELVRRGDIDTVLAVFPDLYGRLMGKRVHGSFFIDQVRGEGMHACDYLLACDMEMDVVPGYSFATWERGYGDMHAAPDLATLRLATWLPKTAMVLCDLARDDHQAPADIAPPNRRRSADGVRSLWW